MTTKVAGLRTVVDPAFALIHPTMVWESPNGGRAQGPAPTGALGVAMTGVAPRACRGPKALCVNNPSPFTKGGPRGIGLGRRRWWTQAVLRDDRGTCGFLLSQE